MQMNSVVLTAAAHCSPPIFSNLVNSVLLKININNHFCSCAQLKNPDEVPGILTHNILTVFYYIIKIARV